VVFGHKHSLWWDLPVRRSFDLARRLYGIDQKQFDKNRAELSDVLNLASILERPVRVLSLGERVKCELAMSLLHSPEVLLLDEPTVGLDLSSCSEIRQYLNRLRSERGMSIFMTSHDMGDIQGCCENVLLLHQGRVQYDGKLSSLMQKFRQDVKVRITPSEGVFDLRACSSIAQSLRQRGAGLEIAKLSQEEVVFKVGKDAVNALSSALIGAFNPCLEISYPDLEEIMLSQLTQWRQER
jgi:ABC-2 type transport system ATP-binding protein